jgi:hypothetical protein
VADITYGPRPYQRGDWLNRLPAMDDDIADMAKRLDAAPANGNQPANAKAAIKQALGRIQRGVITCTHNPPARFVRSKDLEITLSAKQSVSARLYYRHVNQSDRYQNVEMQQQGELLHAVIPGNYTDSNYPLQYYFELKQGSTAAWLYPGLNADLANQPYFAVRSV